MMDLAQVHPITPTEFALKEYAKKLEAEAKRLRFEADQQHDVILPDKEISLNIEIQKYWMRPYAMASVKAVLRGQEILIKGRHDGHTKHFEIGYFIHENEVRDRTAVAQRMMELNKQCLKHVAEIYKR